MKELDMDAEDGMLFLRRKVTAQGKSQAFVNERQVPSTYCPGWLPSWRISMASTKTRPFWLRALP